MKPCRLCRKRCLILACLAVVVLLATSLLLRGEFSAEQQHRLIDFLKQKEKKVRENQDRVDLNTLNGGEERSLHKDHQKHFWMKRDISSNEDCIRWVKLAPQPPYFLTAVLLVRIYEEDKAKLTTSELKMWLQYLRYAGVEHVYIYDAWVYSNESQLHKLDLFLKDGYITYIDWHKHNPYSIAGTQIAAYQNCIDVYKGETQWQTAIDIDEYPFSPADRSPGFLSRYIRQLSESHRRVSEVAMENFLFLGSPLQKELMIQRLNRRTPKPANDLVKPIYRPQNVSAQVHHNSIYQGITVEAPAEELRINHYWGARLQNWGEDTPEVLLMTEVDNSMEPIIHAFKQCELYVRSYLI